jgi:hypothetical protein
MIETRITYGDACGELEVLAGGALEEPIKHAAARLSLSGILCNRDILRAQYTAVSCDRLLGGYSRVPESGVPYNT